MPKCTAEPPIRTPIVEKPKPATKPKERERDAWWQTYKSGSLC